MASLFTQEELDLLLNHPETVKQKARLGTSSQVYFKIDIPETVSQKLKQQFGVNVTNVPMRWFRCDTPEHVDTGYGTILIYLTDSPGQLVIKEDSFPIKAGVAYSFNQGVRHKTVDTGNVPRLVLGPMDKRGNPVGATFVYFLTEADALNGVNAIAYNGGNWVVGDIASGSLHGITEWAVIVNGNIQPANYPNGTDLGLAPYYGNSLNLFPASLNWSVPNVINKDPRFNCFGTDYSGNKIVTFCNIYDYFGSYNSINCYARGIYVSLDSGNTWHLSYNKEDDISGIICDQTAYNIFIYTSTYFSELFYSNNGGISWNSTTPDSYIRSMCCSQNGSVVYYGSNNLTDSIYKSIDSGNSFSNVWNSGLPSGTRWGNVCCNFDGSTIYIASDGTGPGGFMYRSTDYGANWTQVSTAPTGSNISYYVNDSKSSAVQCTPDGTIICAAYYDGNYGNITRSTDSGATWNIIHTTSLGIDIFSLSCDISGNFLGQDSNGPIYYNDSSMNPPDPLNNYQIGLYLVPANQIMLFGGWNGSMNYKSVNLGASYTNLTININQWTSVACNDTGNVIFAVTYSENQNSTGLFISNNKGVSWNEVTSYDFAPPDSWNSCAVNPAGNVLIACGDDYGFIVSSFNGGSTWTLSDIGNGWKAVATNGDGSKLYACGNGTWIYGCFNGIGNIWSQLDGPGSLTAQWSSIACDSTGNRVIACAYNDGVYYSSDAGNTWTELNINFSGNQAWQSVSSSYSGQHLVLCSTDNQNYGNVYISNDYGTTWNNGNLDLANDATAIAGSGNIVYTGQDLVYGRNVFTTTTGNPTGWNDIVPKAPTGNWKSVATNLDGSFVVGAMYGGPLLFVNLNMVCFLGGTKILTNEGYKFIEHLKKGDLVKTLTGPVKVYGIGKRVIHNRALEDTRIKDQLYLLSRDVYQELKENLVLTGCHSLLVDTLPKECVEPTRNVLGDIMLTQGKYRLPACVDPRAEVYPYPGERIVYHVALENISDETNYGIWANGLLVESCPIKRI